MSMLLNAFLAAAASVLSASYATGASSVTMPTHQAGDLILAYGFRNGFTSGMSVASGQNWTVGASGGANTCMEILAYKVAASSSEASGSWTNCSGLMVVVLHKSGATLGVGTISTVTSGSSSTVSYPAITLAHSDGTSIVMGFAAHKKTDTSLETPPTGMNNGSDYLYNGALGEGAVHKTPAGVTSWSLQTVSVGGTSGAWLSLTVEITGAA